MSISTMPGRNHGVGAKARPIAWLGERLLMVLAGKEMHVRQAIADAAAFARSTNDPRRKMRRRLKSGVE